MGMSSHPAKLSFQFTYTEFHHADLRRFNLLFGNFDRLASHECGILNKFCGCLSLSFDPELYREARSPLEHPAFHRFASRLLAEVPALPFMANLQEDALLMILMGSLHELSVVEMDGASQAQITSGKEFGKTVAAMKDQAATWAKKADQNNQEISDLRVALQEYFDRPSVPRGWGGS